MPSKRMSSACVDYVPALCTHRPSLLPIEWSGELFGLWQRFWFAVLMPREDTQTLSFRGRRSRNKVSVGEPAEGSLSFLHPHSEYSFSFVSLVWELYGCMILQPLLPAHPASAVSYRPVLVEPSSGSACLSLSCVGALFRLYLKIIQLLPIDILA